VLFHPFHEVWGKSWASLKFQKIAQFDWFGRWTRSREVQFNMVPIWGPAFLNKSSNIYRKAKILAFLESQHQDLPEYTMVVVILDLFKKSKIIMGSLPPRPNPIASRLGLGLGTRLDVWMVAARRRTSPVKFWGSPVSTCSQRDFKTLIAQYPHSYRKPPLT